MALLALQLVWLVAVPPFRGIDEFDHAYKAAGTARGQVVEPPAPATRGTGAWFTVPPDLVRAARAECESLPYTRWRDCRGAPVADGTRVASGAGRYHPAFYALLGWAALPFDGTAALMAMRVAALTLCLALLVLALEATRRWARGTWPTLLVTASCTPVVLYSTVVAAPNGLEMASALAFWSAGLGLLLPEASVHRRHLAVVAGLSGAVLVTLRPLGPVWCLLAGATLLLAARPPRHHLVALLRSRAVAVAAATVVASTLQATGWVLAEKALVVSNDAGSPEPLGRILLVSLRQVPLWWLQSVGAFPYRDQATLPAVYVCYLLLGLGALALGLRAALPRLRVVLLGGLLVATLVPYAITVRTWSTAAGAWQGRYGLPFVLGLAVLVGWALDRRGVRPSRLLVVLGGLAYAVAQSLSPYDVVVRESRRTALLATREWIAPPAWLVLALALAASAALWWAAARTTGRLSSTAPESAPQAAREAATQRSSSACAAPESTA